MKLSAGGLCWQQREVGTSLKGRLRTLQPSLTLPLAPALGPSLLPSAKAKSGQLLSGEKGEGGVQGGALSPFCSGDGTQTDKAVQVPRLPGPDPRPLCKHQPQRKGRWWESVGVFPFLPFRVFK